MKKILHQSFGPVIALLLFVFSVLVLHSELKEYSYHDLMSRLSALPPDSLIMAIGLTALSFLILTGYDLLASRFVQHPLSYPRIALVSYVSFAFSNALGFSALTSVPLRYSLYSTWGLTAVEITQVAVFCSVTLWIGLCAVGGVVFLVEPLSVPQFLHLPFPTVWPLGIMLLALVAGYLVLTALRKQPLRIFSTRVSLPSFQLSVSQVALASLDWIVACGVFYALLPMDAPPSFPVFLSIFMLGQVAGIISQVPGGLGVFETVIVLLLSPYMSIPVIVSSLVAYRVIYYVFPLLVAALLIGLHEVVRRWESVRWVAGFFGQWSLGIVPNVLSVTTFVGGVILLVSGATPGIPNRLELLDVLIPEPIVELSHFLGSIAGAALLVLARGLQRRLNAAYLLTAALLTAGIVFSLLKGVDFEEAIILAIMLAVLLPCHRYFDRKSSLFAQPFTLGWIIAITLVLGSTFWLGFFSYKHVNYSHDLWWRFALLEDAPRFLRASVGVLTLTLLVFVARLIRPTPPKPSLPSAADLIRVQNILQKVSGTYGNLALLGDKDLMFSESGASFIMYAVEGRSWIAMGNPVGPEGERGELVWRYREQCEQHGGWPVFYQVGPTDLPLYIDLGLTMLKLGEEARIPLSPLGLDGRANKNLRHAHDKPQSEGCTFEIVNGVEASALMPELKAISDAWLAEKHVKEKRFSLGFFNEDYLVRSPIALVKVNDKIVGFANLWLGGDKQELSVDLMRYLDEAPRGVMDYLLIELMLWGKAEGYQWFNMGMAPLAGLEHRKLAPLWTKVGAFIFRYGEQFYNFQGLRAYKDKFNPVWEPRYLVSPGGIALPIILGNLTSLIAGHFKGVGVK